MNLSPTEIRRARVRARARVEAGLFQGLRVTLPGDEVVIREVACAVNAHRRGGDPVVIRSEAIGAIRIARHYLGATEAAVAKALEIIQGIR